MPAVGVTGIVGIAGYEVAAGIAVVAVAAVVGFVAVRVVLVHLVVFAVAFVASEQDVRILLEVRRGLDREPLRHFDRFRRHPFEPWIGLRAFRHCRTPAVPDERHADSRQTLGRTPGVRVSTFAQEPPQCEHRLGERFTHDGAASLRVKAFVGAAGVLADPFQVVADVAHGACGLAPARPLGAEFCSAFEHSLHFGGDGEHGITRGEMRMPSGIDGMRMVSICICRMNRVVSNRNRGIVVQASHGVHPRGAWSCQTPRG